MILGFSAVVVERVEQHTDEWFWGREELWSAYTQMLLQHEEKHLYRSWASQETYLVKNGPVV